MSTLFQSPDLYTQNNTPRRHYYSEPDKHRAVTARASFWHNVFSPRGWWLALFIIGFIVLAVTDAQRTSRAKEDAAKTPASTWAPVTPVPHAPSPEELREKLIFVGQFLVRETLLTPSMARFPADRTHAWHHAETPYTFTVWGEVDSQNAFSAMLRQPFQLRLRYTCPQTYGYDATCWEVLRYQLGNQVYTAPKTATKKR